jgi:hypothetical protein
MATIKPTAPYIKPVTVEKKSTPSTEPTPHQKNPTTSAVMDEPSHSTIQPSKQNSAVYGNTSAETMCIYTQRKIKFWFGVAFVSLLIIFSVTEGVLVATAGNKNFEVITGVFTAVFIIGIYSLVMWIIMAKRTLDKKEAENLAPLSKPACFTVLILIVSVFVVTMLGTGLDYLSLVSLLNILNALSNLIPKKKEGGESPV